VERWNERCTLSSERDIEPAEVRDGRGPRSGCNDIGIAKLQAKRLLSARVVEDGLTMATDRSDIGRLTASSDDQLERAVGEKSTNRHVEGAKIAQTSLRSFD
jgi:hypothetical protein